MYEKSQKSSNMIGVFYSTLHKRNKDQSLSNSSILIKKELINRLG